VFTPRKFQAKQLAGIGGDLWGYPRGGREQTDYYLGPDGIPSEAAAALHGRLWARLGLQRLDRTAFQRLAAGCHPVSGERLVKTSYTTRLDPVSGQWISAGGFHVPGVDCNLSPPKSVSGLLPFVSHHERTALERAHLAAVRVTLEELERRVAACRPTVNGEQIHTPGELGVAVFTHHTSRPTAEVAAEPGRPPDPQLHSHAFVFNLAFCQGRWLAVDSRPIHQFATTAETIYACQLAAELQRLGYRLAWHQTRRVAHGSSLGLIGGLSICSPAATGSSNKLSPTSKPGGAGRRRCGSGAGWPPATAPARQTPAACRLGAPIVPSSSATACRLPPRIGSGIASGWRRRPSESSWCGRGCLALTGSAARMRPSTRRRSLERSTRPPPGCWTPPRPAGSWSGSSPARTWCP
jgi:conjugative relaxase-like TrwC/TraI family protein